MSNRPMGARRSETLCWECSKACGGCSWSDGSFTPIEGWTAVPEQIRVYGQLGETYTVIACPGFDSDAHLYKGWKSKQDPFASGFIQDLKTGKKYYCIADLIDDLEAEIGIKRNTICKRVNDARHKQGKVFGTCGKRFAESGHVPAKCVAVECISIGKVFRSVKDAARYAVKEGICTAMTIETAAGTIASARCKSGKQRFLLWGMEWEYAR